MGNKLHPLLLNNNKYSVINNLFSENNSLNLGSDLNFLRFIENFFNNLNFNLHSFFIRRIDSKIYIFFYYYSNKQIKTKHKYLTRQLLASRKKLNTRNKKKVYSKFVLNRTSFLELHFFLLSFCIYYFNTKKVYLSLINLNYFKGFYFKDNFKNRKKRFNRFLNKRRFEKKILFISKVNKSHLKSLNKKNKLKLEKKINKISILKTSMQNFGFFYIRQNMFFPRSRFIFRKNFNLPSYLKGFDSLIFHSFLYQSAKILGFYLKNLIEFNFHTQKGLRQNRILYFFKRFFYSFVILNKEKNFFFKKASSFLLLKGKFKKDGRKKKRIVRFNLPSKKQKKDSFVDYYSQDIFTRFGTLNFVLYFKGQSFNYLFSKNFFFKSRLSTRSVRSKIKTNKAFLFLFYFIFVFYHAKFNTKIQSIKKKKKKRKNQRKFIRKR
jgi:hypothetical protein